MITINSNIHKLLLNFMFYCVRELSTQVLTSTLSL